MGRAREEFPAVSRVTGKLVLAQETGEMGEALLRITVEGEDGATLVDMGTCPLAPGCGMRITPVYLDVRQAGVGSMTASLILPVTKGQGDGG